MFRPRHPPPRPGFSCPCRCWALARRLSLIPACHPLIPACHPERSEGSAFLRPVRLPIRSPLVPNHEPQIANFFRIRTSKTRHLKSFRIRTYEKRWGGVGVLLLTSYLMRIAVPRSIATRDLSSNPAKDFCPERPSGARDLSARPTKDFFKRRTGC